MDTSIAIIIFALAAFAGGILLIKNYDRLDIRYFADATHSTYTPTGKSLVILSALVGALIGCVFFASEVFRLNLCAWAVQYAAGALLVTCIGAACMQALLSYEALSRALAKCGFITACCLVAFFVGLMGSALAFAAIVIYMFCIIIQMMWDSGFKHETIRTQGGLFESGQDLKQETPGSQIFVGPDGRRWRREGNKVHLIS